MTFQHFWQAYICINNDIFAGIVYDMPFEDWNQLFLHDSRLNVYRSSCSANFCVEARYISLFLNSF